MTRLGVFGGSFDPPHLGHLRIAQISCDHLDLGRLLWIPTGSPPHEIDLELSDSSHRQAMVQLMVEQDSRFKMDLVEINREGPSYTVDTIRLIESAFPETELYLIIGEDQLRVFDTWKDPTAIRNSARLTCYNRTQLGQAAEDPEEPPIWLPGAPMAFSSTAIRDGMRRGERQSVSLLPAVEAYIKSNDLYLER